MDTLRHNNELFLIEVRTALIIGEARQLILAPNQNKHRIIKLHSFARLFEMIWNKTENAFRTKIQNRGKSRQLTAAPNQNKYTNKVF